MALPPHPWQSPVVDKGQKLTEIWNQWFTHLLDSLLVSARTVAATDLTTQAAAITSTALGGTFKTGLFRASYYARITQAASVSSSLTVTLGWTDGAVAQSYSGAAMTGNTTATSQSGSVTFHIDDVSQIKYSTSYASAGSPVMQYMLSWNVERLR